MLMIKYSAKRSMCRLEAFVDNATHKSVARSCGYVAGFDLAEASSIAGNIKTLFIIPPYPCT